MTSGKTAILVVDDETNILRMLKRVLEQEGYRVIIASSGEAALEMFNEESPDLVISDIMMPGIDGYTLCQRIREFSQVPIIMITVKDRDEEKVQGLDFGADDYITKPFSYEVLVARVKAVLRRAKLWDERSEPVFQSRDLTIDFTRRRVMIGNQEINPTATEFRLLSYLARNTGRMVTPQQILQKVWGDEYLDEIHILQVTIARLRNKLQDNAKNPNYILTKPGIGYMLIKQA